MRRSIWKWLFDYLPRGGMLDEADWQRRHRLLQRVLLGHVPGLAVLGLLLGHSVTTVGLVLVAPIAALVVGHVLPGRRGPAVAVTAGLVYCSTALVGLSGGAIEAHFHFFIIIGFIALYQDWAPFLCNILLTVFTHGLGSAWQQNLIFEHSAGQAHPWMWSLLHGAAVLAACVGMTMFWRVTEDSQNERNALVGQLAEVEVGRRQFTSDLLLNLARRNQAMLYRQLDIINHLEEAEQDPDVLSELFRLDHLATRVRRNAESLLVLSGEQPPRVWREPVALRDVVRAAIAETEDFERVAFTVDEVTAVSGRCVTDLTHLLAELTENAVRYSPPDSVVTIRTRPTSARRPGGYLLTIEDWGVGMPEEDLAAANALLADPPEVDLSVAQRLGFHVVARLAARHGISVSLDGASSAGTTATVHLPAELLEQAREPARHAAPERVASRVTGADVPQVGAAAAPAPTATGPLLLTGTAGGWSGWWDVLDRPEAPLFLPAQRSGESAPGAAAASRPGALVAAAEPPVSLPGTLFVPVFTGPSSVVAARAEGPPGPPTPAEPGPDDPAPRGTEPADPPSTTVHGLRRRVPQASLAPELRQPAGDAVPAPPVVRAAAAGALSRYQAGRRSAEAASATDDPGTAS